MKLIEAHTTHYRSILDSNPVKIGQTTCLVGKNDPARILATVRTLAIKALPLADEWAVRELHICVRDLATLALHARRLVDHLRG
jgi:hypothetical protein